VNLLTASTDLISIFLFTTLFLFFARKVAKKIGLVDKPNFRKRHQGLIPLVGGISVYAGICFTFLIADYYIPHATLYLACAGVLVFIGALDDRFDISVKIRATIQAIIGIIMMAVGKLYLLSLGFIFGPWEMVLGPFGYFLTLFAVWAAINAFNMVDGIDGLLGGLSSVSFAAMGLILWFDGQTSLAIWCFAMIAAILPYILLNLGILGRRYKVFMGDAGSTLIGFTVIWILLETTQGPTHPISPVTALWIIAIPLMDMVAIMYRRYANFCIKIRIFCQRMNQRCHFYGLRSRAKYSQYFHIDSLRISGERLCAHRSSVAISSNGGLMRHQPRSAPRQCPT
jgi:UDP-GlcNAc:undecaprenyl-phosphate/decaprenyl-phosphate GlcNAc-1-phosphate transferase